MALSIRRLLQDHLVVTLVMLTLVAATIVVLSAYLARKRTGDKARFQVIALACMAVVLALVTSYGVLGFKPDKTAGLWPLLSPSALFFANVLLKLLLIFWSTVIVTSLFRPGNMSEFSAKFLGTEFSLKYEYEHTVEEVTHLQEMIRVKQAEQDGVAEASRSRAKLAADLNAAIFAFIESPFEEAVLKAQVPADAVREAIRDVLVDAYYDFREAFRIHVVPLTAAGLAELDEHLSSLVRLSMRGEANVAVVRHGTGIGIYPRPDGFGTAVAIEALNGHEVSLAEICAASTLFIAVANAAT